MNQDPQRLLTGELLAAIREALTQDERYSAVDVEPNLGYGLRPDLLAIHDDMPMIIEVKAVAPQTRPRIYDIIGQLQHYSSALQAKWPVPLRMILAVPGELSGSYFSLLQNVGIEVWDRTYLIDLFQKTNSEVANRVLKILLNQDRDAPRDLDQINTLLDGLQLPYGRNHWSGYQRFCADVLQHLFTPPLEQPIYESSNETKVNRRDIILPNYSTEDFGNSCAMSIELITL